MVVSKHVISVTLERCVIRLPSSHHPNNTMQKRFSVLFRKAVLFFIILYAKASLGANRYYDLKSSIIHISISHKHATRRRADSPIH